MAFLYLLYESNPQSSISYRFYQKFRMFVDSGRCAALAQILKLTSKFNTASGSGGILLSPGADTTASPSETSPWGSLGLGHVMELEWRNEWSADSVDQCCGRKGEHPVGLCAEPLPQAFSHWGAQGSDGRDIEWNPTTCLKGGWKVLAFSLLLYSPNVFVVQFVHQSK